MPFASRTQCGLHPNEAAADMCARCGTFLCHGCVLVMNATVYCAACLEKRMAPPPSEPVPDHVYVTLVIAALGLVVFPCALAGIGLAWFERRQMLRGRVPRSGERYARIASGLGTLGLFTSIPFLCFMSKFFMSQ